DKLKIALKLSKQADGTTSIDVDSSDVIFTIPNADAAPFQTLFDGTLAGNETILPLQIDYLDDNGFPLLTVTEQVVVESVGPADVFQPFDPNGATQVACHKTGLNAVNVKLA